MAPALSACLKYSLAFLLGAVTLGLILFLQFQRDAIRVEIHWKGGAGLSSKALSYSPDIDHNYSSTGVVKPSNVALLDASQINNPKDSSINVRSRTSEVKLQQKSNLLSRRARQLSQYLSEEESLNNNSNIASNVVGSHRRSRRANVKTKSIIRSEDYIGTPIEEVLSRGAPDWVGSAIPPAQLPNVERCSDAYCLEYLSKVERRQFDECKQRTLIEQDRIGSIQSNDSCHFQNGTSRHPVALASFQGSGSTWMRGLLQKITGICTGI
jgi:hypothetical protein